MSHLAANAAAALLAAIWQGSILVAVVACTIRLLPAMSAATRSFLWTATFALLIALHLLPALQTAYGSANAASLHPFHIAPIWSIALAVLWLTLSLFRAAQLLLSAHRLHQISSRAVAVSEEIVHALHLAPLARSSGTVASTSRPFTLCISPDVDRPSVLGFLRPRILLPSGLLETLTQAELQQILLHETEHLRRSDDWTNLLQKLALVLFPLNPVLTWVERRMCLERELACDQHVLAAGENVRKSYATTLTRLAEHSMLRRGLHLALGLFGKRPSELSTRVHRILTQPARTLTLLHSRVASITVMVCVLGLSATLANTPSLVTFNPSHAPEEAQSHGIIPPAPEAKRVLARATLNASYPQPSPHTLEVKAHLPARQVVRKKMPAYETTRMINTFESAHAEEEDAIPSHLLRTSIRHTQVQQFVIPTLYYIPAAYAAVRTSDGWIIFQL